MIQSIWITGILVKIYFSTNGNTINCLFEDQLYWKIDTFPSGTTYGF